MTDRYLFRGFHPCEDGAESVWIEEKEIKGKWVYGYYEKYTDRHLINTTTDRLNSGGYPIRGSIDVIPETVGQYIGIEADGQKVFESDIVNVECFGKGVIIWCDVCLAYEIDIGDCGRGFAHINLEDYPLELLGNIHSNPDILEEIING